MTDTPILDEAVRRVSNLQEIGYTDVRVLVADALRAALPWEPPAETIETMAGAAYHVWFGEHASPKWGEAVISQDTWRAAAFTAYRANPTLRELYPERFR